MKKSEAITQASIEFQRRSDAQQYKGYSNEGLAEEFLSIYESMGMLPPAVEGLVATEENKDGEIVIPIWTWETEDVKSKD